MDAETPSSDNEKKRIIKTTTAIMLGVFVIVLLVVGLAIYSWQHKKVTSLQQQVKTLNIQLQYVQNEQNKLERQIK